MDLLSYFANNARKVNKMMGRRHNFKVYVRVRVCVAVLVYEHVFLSLQVYVCVPVRIAYHSLKSKGRCRTSQT